MSIIETLDALNTSPPSLYIGSYEKTNDELKKDLISLSGWLIEQVDCNWCVIKECFDNFENSHIKPIFEIFLSLNIFDKFNNVYFDYQGKELIEIYVKRLGLALSSASNRKDEHIFFHHFVNYCTLHLKSIRKQFDIDVSIDSEVNIAYQFIIYVEDNWSNKTYIRFGHIFNFINDCAHEKLIHIKYKSEYEKWVRKHFGFDGGFDYDKPIPKKIQNQLSVHLLNFDRISVAKTS